jgi:hypothetical protein
MGQCCSSSLQSSGANVLLRGYRGVQTEGYCSSSGDRLHVKQSMEGLSQRDGENTGDLGGERNDSINEMK